jgi:hypothetical protein
LHGLTKIAELPQDADWAAEVDSNGFLQVHQSPVVTSGDWVVVPSKDGFTDVFNEATTRYHIAAYRWNPSVTAVGAKLGLAWTADTDFATVDGAVCSFGCMTNGYVQQFAVTIANGSVYAPAAHGQILRLALTTGAVQSTIDPFAGTSIDGDARLIVDGAPMFSPDPSATLGGAGTVYYTATAWPTDASPFGKQPRGSWLVKVVPSNASTLADWSPDNVVKLGGAGIASPTVGVPRLADLCEYAFGTAGQNPLTGPDSVPPKFWCGTQRPALNSPIAFSAVTGHLLGYSYANNARGVGFLIEIDPATLKPIRAADMRDNHLVYGCGVRLDVPTFPGCDLVTAGGTVNLGVDPAFGAHSDFPYIRFRTPADIMDNAPTISPDGQRWTVGSYDGGFSFEAAFDPPAGYDARGSMIEFDATGAFHGNNPDFGWEVTESALPGVPGVLTGTFPVRYSWLQDRGLYSLGHLGVARYTSDFALQSVGEAPDQLFGDFVDTNIPFGPFGDHYGVTEFGILYKFDAASQIVESVQLTEEPIEVLSGPIARDRAGRLYASYAGRVHVIASSGQPSPAAIFTPKPEAIARMARAHAAKQAAPAQSPDPGPPTL